MKIGAVFCISSFLVVLTAAPVPAQLGSSRVAGSVGVLAFESTHGQTGVGVGAAGRFAVATSGARRLGVELGLQTLTPYAPACALSVRCNELASPVWHARVFGSTRLNAETSTYVTAGIGGYGPVGAADQPEKVVLGLDFGLGFKLWSRAALEARVLHLRTTHFVGWAFPISLVVGL